LTFVKDLIEKAQQDNLDAFGELVLIYQDKVYSHCHYLAGNPDDAQDLAQDVFVQAFKGMRSFRNDADFGTWLHRIAVNLWINFCRRNKKVVSFSLDEPIPVREGEVSRELAASEENPLEKVERSEFNAMVGAALNTLLPEFRTVLILREIEGYNYDEIASMLECSLGTVKSRISRGRKALKKELEKQL
jgi:RNA polymerase sigma-70 factor (ECF subfamily)